MDVLEPNKTICIGKIVPVENGWVAQFLDLVFSIDLPAFCPHPKISYDCFYN